MTYHRRGEVLVLEIDPVPGRGDRLKIERLDLPGLRPRVAGRLGAGDAERKISDVGLEILGPGIAAIEDRLELLAGGPPPAFADEVAEGAAAASPSTAITTSWRGP
jgi:hypothetical protein